MPSNVEINITARDQASGKLNQLSTAFQNITGMSLSAVSAVALLGTAIKKSIDFAKQGVTETVNYAAQIRDLGRLTGMSAEETSRMIQVTDDLDLSYQSLTTSLQAAVRKGVDPSITSIAALSDEYLALEPGLERSKFLMDNFGRAGADMAKVMEQGGDALLQMSENMDESMILTGENVQAARDYEIALDTLGDSITAIKLRMGNEFIPKLTAAIDRINNHAAATDRMSDSLIDLKNRLTPTTNSIVDMAAANDELSQAAKDAGYYIKDGALWMHDAASGARTLIDENYILTQGYIEAYNAINDYNTALANVQIVTGLTYTSNEDYIESLWNVAPAAEDAAAAQDELATALGIINTAFGKLTTNMLFGQAAEGLDAESTLQLARSLGLLDENTYSALTAVQDFKDGLDAGEDGILSMEEGAGRLITRVKGINNSMVELYPGLTTTQTALLNNSLAAFDMGSKIGIANDGVVTLGESISNYASPTLEQLTDDFGRTQDSAALAADATGGLLEHLRGLPTSTYTRIVTEFIEIHKGKWEGMSTEALGQLLNYQAITGIGTFGSNVVMPQAEGGPVSANSPYLVGEVGPELFIPNRSGTIIPNDRLGGGGNVIIQINGPVYGNNIDRMMQDAAKIAFREMESKRL